MNSACCRYSAGRIVPVSGIVLVKLTLLEPAVLVRISVLYSIVPVPGILPMLPAGTYRHSGVMTAHCVPYIAKCSPRRRARGGGGGGIAADMVELGDGFSGNQREKYAFIQRVYTKRYARMNAIKSLLLAPPSFRSQLAHQVDITVYEANVLLTYC